MKSDCWIMTINSSNVDHANITIDRGDKIMYGQIGDKRDAKFMNIVFKSDIKNFFSLSGWM